MSAARAKPAPASTMEEAGPTRQITTNEERVLRSRERNRIRLALGKCATTQTHIDHISSVDRKSTGCIGQTRCVANGLNEVKRCAAKAAQDPNRHDTTIPGNASHAGTVVGSRRHGASNMSTMKRTAAITQLLITRILRIGVRSIAIASIFTVADQVRAADEFAGEIWVVG